MTEAKHTPGPWDAAGLTVYDTCMDGVASTHTAADARLIAAAPDMLDALKGAREHMEWSTEQGKAAFRKVIDAIAKAEGRA